MKAFTFRLVKILKWIARSKIVFVFWVIVFFFKRGGNVLFTQGVHFVGAPSGGGKTLLSTFIIKTLTERKNGFFWVNKNQYKDHKVMEFDMEKVWNKGKMLYRLDRFISGKGLCLGLIADEVNSQFNRRQNREKAYNEVFLPFITNLVQMRHAGYNRVYLLGQNKMLQDTQLQSILKYQHEVFSRKPYRYFFFKTGKKYPNMIRAPKSLWVISYINKGFGDEGKIKWKKIGIQRIKISIELLLSYDQHGFADDIDKLPAYTKKGDKIAL